MKTQVTFSQAVEGYLLAANARHLSQYTLQEYLNTFRKFLAYTDSDPPIENITRASELCNLQINHVDIQNQRLTVLGKGSKERTIPFSSRTGQAIWRYLTQRKKDTTGDPLFVTIHGRQVTRDQILKAIQRLGKRAGIEGANLHRFRHTFAINYLRNGGDPWSLQMILGHSTMEMVKTYLALAQADLEMNHKIASPVDNWRL